MAKSRNLGRDKGMAKSKPEDLAERAFAAARGGSAFGLRKCISEGLRVQGHVKTIVVSDGFRPYHELFSAIRNDKCLLQIAALSGSTQTALTVWNQLSEATRKSNALPALVAATFRGDLELCGAWAAEALPLCEAHEIARFAELSIRRGYHRFVEATCEHYPKDMLVGAFGQIPQTVLGLLVATRAPSAILEIALKRFDPCQSDELGRTPLMVSAIAGDLNAAKLLYSRSDTSARDTQGSTAYEYALAMNVDGVRADVFSFFEAMEIGDAAPIAAPAQRTRLRM